ncbi:hypothetical protein QR77_00010 [Streptomyces sp. 150FB]|nr:hypothetical protein QR77_00010 [Streptomyces sp. 150FB]
MRRRTDHIDQHGVIDDLTRLTVVFEDAGSRSRTINGVRIATEPWVTCPPVVADHHRPGPQLRPGTTG